jgi:predicted RNA-binding Zn-ribbon protein involved in translation (DUF1610 family)
MSDVVQKCEVCGGLIDEEDLFCANCGTEAPQSDTTEHDKTVTSTHNFHCDGCGASMSYDAAAQALLCPFCGSDNVSKQPDAKILRPQSVVPFVKTQADVQQIMRDWLGKGYWRPGDLAKEAEITKATAVYVPYWVFKAKTHTFWTADTDRTPAGARGDWFPLFGEHYGEYEGALIGASSTLTPAETSDICPFDLAQATAPEEINYDGLISEQFRVPRKYARPLARKVWEEAERNACAPYVPGKSRNVKVNVRVEDQHSEPILLPVWILAYRYEDKVFRFLVNGQTGKATGKAPTSWKKVGSMIGIGVGVLALLLLLAMICGGVLSL